MVTDGQDTWSAYLRRMTSREGWSVARLAREAGIARSTIFRWIADGAQAVTIASVHAVADALGDERANALRAASGIPALDRDPEIEMILASDRPEAVKRSMIERLTKRREVEREQRIADLRLMLGDD